jgi:hypothetical protein
MKSIDRLNILQSLYRLIILLQSLDRLNILRQSLDRLNILLQSLDRLNILQSLDRLIILLQSLDRLNILLQSLDLETYKLLTSNILISIFPKSHIVFHINSNLKPRLVHYDKDRQS